MLKVINLEDIAIVVNLELDNVAVAKRNIKKRTSVAYNIVGNEKIEKTRFKPDISLQQEITELIKGYQVIRRNQFSST